MRPPIIVLRKRGEFLATQLPLMVRRAILQVPFWTSLIKTSGLGFQKFFWKFWILYPGFKILEKVFLRILYLESGIPQIWETLFGSSIQILPIKTWGLGSTKFFKKSWIYKSWIPKTLQTSQRFLDTKLQIQDFSSINHTNPHRS